MSDPIIKPKTERQKRRLAARLRRQRLAGQTLHVE